MFWAVTRGAGHRLRRRFRAAASQAFSKWRREMFSRSLPTPFCRATGITLTERSVRVISCTKVIRNTLTFQSWFGNWRHRQWRLGISQSIWWSDVERVKGWVVSACSISSAGGAMPPGVPTLYCNVARHGAYLTISEWNIYLLWSAQRSLNGRWSLSNESEAVIRPQLKKILWPDYQWHKLCDRFHSLTWQLSSFIETGYVNYYRKHKLSYQNWNFTVIVTSQWGSLDLSSFRHREYKLGWVNACLISTPIYSFIFFK